MSAQRSGPGAQYRQSRNTVVHSSTTLRSGMVAAMP